MVGSRAVNSRPDSVESRSDVRYRQRSGIVVGRFRGTVIVTVHGPLDEPRAGDLGYVLADLIDGQGNRSLVVDLHDTSAPDHQWLSVLTDAVARARRRGATLRLNQASAGLDAALRRAGLAESLGPLAP